MPNMISTLAFTHSGFLPRSQNVRRLHGCLSVEVSCRTHIEEGRRRVGCPSCRLIDWQLDSPRTKSTLATFQSACRLVELKRKRRLTVSQREFISDSLENLVRQGVEGGSKITGECHLQDAVEEVAGCGIRAEKHRYRSLLERGETVNRLSSQRPRKAPRGSTHLLKHRHEAKLAVRRLLQFFDELTPAHDDMPPAPLWQSENLVFILRTVGVNTSFKLALNQSLPSCNSQ